MRLLRVALLLMVLVVTGCGSGGSKSGIPGIGPTPTDPDDFFTGEPTPLKIVIRDNAPGTQVATLSVDEATPETHTIALAIGRYNQAGHETDPDITYYDIPSDQAETTVVVELPALPNYHVAAVRFFKVNDIPPPLHPLRLVSYRSKRGVNIGSETINEIELVLQPPDVELHVPDIIYGGDPVNLLTATITEDPNPGYPLGYDFLIGLNPWSVNGIDGLWKENDEETGWITALGGNFPDPETTVTLYYQIRVCTVGVYTGMGSACAFYPDVSIEPLLTTELRPSSERQ